MKKKTLLLLSVSAGAGHVRAAQALEACVNEKYSGWKAIHLDVMDFVPKIFRKLYADSYVKVVQSHPEFWGYLYNHTDKVYSDNSIIKKLRVAIERLNTRKLDKKIAEISPDCIISTHFLPPEMYSRKFDKGEKLPPFWVQVTDYDIHALWIHKHMAGYFVGSDEVACRLADRGILADSIHVTGIPIMPVFSKKFDKKKIHKELSLDPKRKTALLMSGGCGIGSIDEVSERLLQGNKDLQIIALAGRNEKLLLSLQKIAEKYSGRMIPMGFTTTIERLMSVSDIAVTKPGGLTTSECLAMGLPLIVISPIPGQEERNSDYLLEYGAGLKAHDTAGLEYRVKRILEDKKLFETMKKNALLLGKPDAGYRVLEKALGEKI